MTVLLATDLHRRFQVGDAEIRAIDGVDLALRPGELVLLLGRSGAGKTTLLSMLAGIDRPDEGSISLNGLDLSTAGERELSELRRSKVSLVVQSGGLIPILTAAENVELPLRVSRVDPVERARLVDEVLSRVGLTARADHRPEELSGGEQQRVALARALVTEPSILLADEPTGQLDSETGLKLMRMIRELVDRLGLAALVATHDPGLADHAHRVLHLNDGRIFEESPARP
ncbi:MAG: ABC transporter ATP-binding protein [Acidimicrobiia bacterium]